RLGGRRRGLSLRPWRGGEHRDGRSHLGAHALRRFDRDRPFAGVGCFRPPRFGARAAFALARPRGAFAFAAGFVRSRTSILSSCLAISRRNASAGIARSIAATPRNGTSPRAIMRAAAAVG